MPLPAHGPISEFRIVTFIEFERVTQSPVVEVICMPSMMVPFCPEMLSGPDGFKGVGHGGKLVAPSPVEPSVGCDPPSAAEPASIVFPGPSIEASPIVVEGASPPEPSVI